MKTAGRWPWKSESAKECVTTHLPNEAAPKMDDCKSDELIPHREGKKICVSLTLSRVGRRVGFCEGLWV